MHVADAHKQKPKIDPATWKSVRTVLTYAGIYLLGVLTMPIWVLIALWVEVSVMGERTQCEGISRTGYWEEVMRSYRDRSKTDTQTNWYGINPLNPETTRSSETRTPLSIRSCYGTIKAIRLQLWSMTTALLPGER